MSNESGTGVYVYQQIVKTTAEWEADKTVPVENVWLFERRYPLHRFKEMGLSCFEPFGAFYVFPCISEFGMTSEQFATELLNTEKLAVVPGTAFGDCGEGFIRISYAYSLENLKEAMNRMEAFITGLRKQGEKQA